MNNTILLVDDEPDVLSSLQRVFIRDSSLHVLTAENGSEALRILEQSNAAVVVSDLKMPGMDGTALLTRIQHTYPDTIQIMLTGHADTSTVKEYLNKDIVYRFLEKPFTPVGLRNTVHDALDRYRSRRKHALHIRQLATNERLLEKLMHTLRVPGYTFLPIEDSTKETERLERQFNAFVKAVTAAIESRVHFSKEELQELEYYGFKTRVEIEPGSTEEHIRKTALENLPVEESEKLERLDVSGYPGNTAAGIN